MQINKTMGLIAAPFTPMHPDRSINYDCIDAYAQRLHSQGVVGAFICGTTGEGMSLTTDERRRIAERWVAAAPAGLRVLVHVGHNCLSDCRELAAHAQAIGADSISCLSPSFFKPNGVDGLVQWCAEVAEAAPEVPFYFYHIPSMTGVELEVSEFLQLAQDRIASLVGVKFTCENLDDFQRCLAFADGRYDILFGRDELLHSALRLGARGAVGSTYNFAASLYHAVIRAFQAGDQARAVDLQSVAVRMIDRLIRGGGHPVANFKCFMSHIAMDCGPARLPLHAPTTQQAAAMQAALKDIAENFLSG